MTFLFRNLPPPYTTREFQDILPNGTQDMVCTRFPNKRGNSKIESLRMTVPVRDTLSLRDSLILMFHDLIPDGDLISDGT